jgi:hypothetical protein
MIGKLLPTGGSLRRAVLLAACFPAGHAFAGAETHIRLANATVIPSVGVGMEFRSNTYYEEVDPEAGLCLVIQPAIDAAVKKDTVEAEFSGSYPVKVFLTGQSNLNRFGDFRVSGDLSVLPKAVVGVVVGDDASNISRPVGSDDPDATPYVSRISNDLAGALAVRPGPAFQLLAGGDYLFQDYRYPPGISFEGNPNFNSENNYGPDLDIKWLFLPKTALVASASMDWFNWSNNILVVTWCTEETGGKTCDPTNQYGSFHAVGNVLGVPDGSSWRFKGGLLGSVTERLSVELQVGYGELTVDPQSVISATLPTGAEDLIGDELNVDSAGFNKNATGGLGFLANVSGTYTPREGQKTVVGYEKNFRESYFTDFLSFHRFYLYHRQRVGTRFGLEGRVTYRYEMYRGEVNRNDHYIRLGPSVAYEATKYIKVNLDSWWERRASGAFWHGYSNSRNRLADIEYDDFGLRLMGQFTY